MIREDAVTKEGLVQGHDPYLELFARLVPGYVWPELWTRHVWPKLLSHFAQGHVAYPVTEKESWFGELPIVGTAKQAHVFVLDQGFLYPSKRWMEQSTWIRWLLARKSQRPQCVGLDQLTRHLQWLWDEPHSMQAAMAACAALRHSVVVLHGGPGTGKTTTAAKLLALRLLHAPQQSLRIQACAPTGKAARRLSHALQQGSTFLPVPELLRQCIPRHALTLHHLLGLGQGEYLGFTPSPVRADILLIDEASMVDLRSMYLLTQALVPHTQLILLGDSQQLPAVDYGDVLSDLVRYIGPREDDRRWMMDHIPSSWLTHQANTSEKTLEHTTPTHDEHLPLGYVHHLIHGHRFSERSHIGQLARDIRQGHHVSPPWRNKTDWQQDADQHWQRLGQLAQHQEAHEHELWLCLQAWILLACDTTTVECINHESLLRFGSSSIGLPYLITRNRHDLGLSNGDVVVQVLKDQRPMLVAKVMEYGQDTQCLRYFSPEQIQERQLAFAMTVHKSQGSEYECVGLVLPKEHHPGVSRKLLYTALTRAKEDFFVDGSAQVWQQALMQQESRHTGFLSLATTLQQQKSTPD